MKHRGQAKELTEKFVARLEQEKIITVKEPKPLYVFGSMIPIGGVIKRTSTANCLLIGDAAGYCGAFAADGIKGSVISGKESAKLIDRYLKGDKAALLQIHQKVDQHGSGLLKYYQRQLRYRFIWDLMKSNRSFQWMFKIIASEKESFLSQFCDSKDRHRSLTRTVLKFRYIPKLIHYSLSIFLDRFRIR